MNQSKSILLLCALLLTLGTDVLAQTSTESPVSTNVTLTFSVVDKNNSPFRTLLKEDLRILEDDKPQQIIALKAQVEVPVNLSFLIDMSISQERVIHAERAAALSFVNSVFRPGTDMGSVATFTGDLSVKQAVTGDLKEVQSAIEHLEFVPPPSYIGGGAIVSRGKPSNDQVIAGSTAIWDAICLTCEQILAQSNTNSRRVIILMTDGEDTNSQKKLSDALDCAMKSNVIIYSVGIGDAENFGIQQGLLRKLSERTGGRAFFPKKVNEMEASLAQVQQELRFQYLVTYSSINKKPVNSYRKVKIEIINREKKENKLKLAYPQGYFPRGS